MEIMGKCPFWGEPCIKEECSAFERTDKTLWSNLDRQSYKAFKQVKESRIIQHHLSGGTVNKEVYDWVAKGIPYCRVLDKELPMKNTINFLEVQSGR
jgi:hypothetical protein